MENVQCVGSQQWLIGDFELSRYYPLKIQEVTSLSLSLGSFLKYKGTLVKGVQGEILSECGPLMPLDSQAVVTAEVGLQKNSKKKKKFLRGLFL